MLHCYVHLRRVILVRFHPKVAGGSVLSSVSKMLEKVSEGMAMAVAIAAGDLTLDELEEKVNKTRSVYTSLLDTFLESRF